MGLTYTRADDRTTRPTRAVAVSVGEWLLVATSAVVVLAIALAYEGRLRADRWAAGSGEAPAPVVLDGAVEVASVEQALASTFEFPGDRRVAARAIVAAAGDAARRGGLANVGALARLDLDAAAVARDRSLVTLSARVDPSRPRVPLLTASELATFKPFVAVRTSASFRSAVLWSAVVLVLSVHAISLLWRWRGGAGDRVLLALVHLLTGVGFVVLVTRLDPLRDSLLIVRYTQGLAIGAALCAAVSLVDLRRAVFRELSFVPLVAALALSVSLVVFGSGPGTSTAKVNLGPVQPIEAIRLLLGLFLAGYFARRWELLRQVHMTTLRGRAVPSWLRMPKPAHVLPVAMGVAAALVLFVFQRDLGPALLLALMFLSLFAVARGGFGLAFTGLAGLGAGVVVSQALHVSDTLTARVAMWQSPWDNAVRGGDQVAHALWGLASGAAAGTGLGLGHARLIPEGHTDLVLAAIGEELGLAGLLLVLAVFALVAWRGLTIARRASTDYGFFLAVAMTLSLIVPVLVMAGGVLGLLPLTGVVTPFLSYGGSAMVANFVAVGLIAAVAADRTPTADLAPFHVPLRRLSWAATAAGLAVVAMAVTVQAVKADEYLVRPQLGLQADGGRRFQYNPRVLDALRQVPRGSILDRAGLPIATGDHALVAKAAPAYAAAGIRVASACATATERCYPLGPTAFHLLGDVNTRANWAAANSSYLERDAEDLLRGFDDKARTIETRGRDGATTLAVRRDYAAAVPLVRHRYEPEHPDVHALLARSRDVTTTIDARFQAAVARILATSARTNGSGRGAVVVLDAATGQTLASVSYPWPGVLAEEDGADADAVLDRARYGLYPPGSTFKLITAAAALREGPRLSAQPFMCQWLPSGRIGVKMPGYGPPIHDDAKDTHPHGAVTMGDGIVRSCNAYFAQLAVALGPEALTRTASAAGIALNTSRTAERVRANLPHAGYGQGEVLVSPLRLARVAAAIATDGTIRETPIAGTQGAPMTTTLLDADSAHTLAGYLRDAVLTGTGRTLRDHPARIAGKTGTAEVDGAGSHAWFAGFAPHGPAARRIAFAVILEHAGYGGAAAARVAGAVATAATSAGLLR